MAAILLMARRLGRLLILMSLLAGGLAGCSALVSSTTQSFAEDLSTAILDNDDLEMIRDGAPAYLILVDTLVSRSPTDPYMLQQSAKLHSAYAAAFVMDSRRAKLLHAKAKRQALDSVCYALKNSCKLDERPYREFEAWSAQLGLKDAPIIYNLAVTWAGWVQANSDDFNAIAELARVKALMLQIARLDPAYDNGGVALYLGVLETLFPPAMGGKPEVGRQYFEQAIASSQGRNLMAKVMFAEQYARLVFNRTLHDELLEQVSGAPARAEGLTLMNTVAKEQAQRLLDSADDYF